MTQAVRDFDPRAVPAGTVVRVHKAFGTQPEGTPATYPVIVIAGEQPGPTAVLVAGVHGDEYEGPQALLALADEVRPAHLRGRLVIIPVAHLAAFAAGLRASPVDGANLARIFPGDPAGTITYRLAHDLFETVVRGADFLVDLHSGGVAYAFVQVAGWYPESARVTAEVAAGSFALARDLGLPWLWRLPARDGVLSHEAVKAGVPATGAEAGGRGGCRAEDVSAYLAGIRRILARRDMIEAPYLPELPTATIFLDGDLDPSPAAGLFEPLAALGSRVRAGEAVARVRSPMGDVLAELTAAREGIVMAMRHLRTVREGEGAVCVARELPL